MLKGSHICEQIVLPCTACVVSNLKPVVFRNLGDTWRYSLTLKITSYYNDFKLCQRDMMVKRITYPNLVKFPFYFTDILSGWWFGTCFIFYFIYGMSSFPLTFIFFRGVGQPPTRLTIIYHGKSLFSMGKSPF